MSDGPPPLPPSDTKPPPLPPKTRGSIVEIGSKRSSVSGSTIDINDQMHRGTDSPQSAGSVRVPKATNGPPPLPPRAASMRLPPKPSSVGSPQSRLKSLGNSVPRIENLPQRRAEEDSLKTNSGRISGSTPSALSPGLLPEGHSPDSPANMRNLTLGPSQPSLPPKPPEAVPYNLLLAVNGLPEYLTPFQHFTKLIRYPAHLTVYLNFLLISDISEALYFYMDIDYFIHTDFDDVEKARVWATRIFHEFLDESASPLPLRQPDPEVPRRIQLNINLPYATVASLKDLWRGMHAALQSMLSDLLNMFCTSLHKGLGDMYGIPRLEFLDMSVDADHRDLALDILSPHFQNYTENMRASPSMQAQAVAQCQRDRIVHFSMLLGIDAHALDRAFDAGSIITVRSHRLKPAKLPMAMPCAACRSFVLPRDKRSLRCANCRQVCHGWRCLENLGADCALGGNKRRATEAFYDDAPLAVPQRNESLLADIDVQSAASFGDPSAVTIGEKSWTETSPQKIYAYGEMVDDDMATYSTAGLDFSTHSGSQEDEYATTSVAIAMVEKRRKGQSTQRSVTSTREKPGRVPSALAAKLDNIASAPSFWLEYAEGAIPSDCPTEEMKRQEVVFEIIMTERRYGHDLETLRSTFWDTLARAGVLNESEARFIFGNIEELYRLNQLLIKDLVARQKEAVLVGTICDIFQTKIHEFRCYESFCSQRSEALNLVKEKRERDSRFSQSLKQCEASENCRRLPLEAFLSCPLQRLTKYPLLLKTLLQLTPEGSPDKPHVQQLQQDFANVVTDVNMAVRRAESRRRLRQIEKQVTFASNVKKRPFVKNDRSVQKEGYLTLAQYGSLRKRRILQYVVLCNDVCFVFTQKDNRRVLDNDSRLIMDREPIDTSEIMVRSQANSPDAFFLVYTRADGTPAIDEFHAEDSEEAQSWVEQMKLRDQTYQRKKDLLRKGARSEQKVAA
eukprot:Clim_evm19s55 gene=Clim_evmTU19s55